MIVTVIVMIQTLYYSDNNSMNGMSDVFINGRFNLLFKDVVVRKKYLFYETMYITKVLIKTAAF